MAITPYPDLTLQTFEGDSHPKVDLASAVLCHPATRTTLLICLVVELMLLAYWRSGTSGSNRWLVYAVIDAGWKSELLHATLMFVFAFLAVGLARLTKTIRLADVLRKRISVRFFGVHALAVVASTIGPSISFGMGIVPGPFISVLFRFVFLGLAAGSAVLCFFTPSSLLFLAKAFDAWSLIISGAFALLITPVTRYLWSLSSPLSRATFWVVKQLLGIHLHHLIVIPEQRLIGTTRFSVTVAPGCSGLESILLLLFISLLYLWYARSKHRFPHALLLIPAGLGMLFALNSARIAALVLLGDSGAENLAVNGFHSQTGWIGFNIVAIFLWFAIRRIQWFSATPDVATFPSVESSQIATNPAAPYLMPLLVFLAAQVLLRSAGVTEPLSIGLQCTAAALTLAFYHFRFLSLPWKPSWRSVATGLAVFLGWIVLSLLHLPTPITSSDQFSWRTGPASYLALLMFSALLSIVVPPIVQELAFRGFLLRRIQATNFDEVSYGVISVRAIIVSSLIFGALYGRQWIAGFLAGIAYALLIRRTRHLGDVIFAHATTAALLAVTLIVQGRALFGQ